MKKILLTLFVFGSIFFCSQVLAADLRFEVNDLVVENCPLNVDIYLNVYDEIPVAADIKILKNDSFVLNSFTSDLSYFKNHLLLTGTAMGSGMNAENYFYVNYYDQSSGLYEEDYWSWFLGVAKITPVYDYLDLQFYMLGSGINSDDSNVVFGIENNTKFVDILYRTNYISIPVLDGPCRNLSLSEKEMLKKIAFSVGNKWVGDGIDKKDELEKLSEKLKIVRHQKLTGYLQYILLQLMNGM